MSECTGEAKEKEGEFDELAGTTCLVAEKQFIFIRLCVLREVSWEKGGKMVGVWREDD